MDNRAVAFFDSGIGGLPYLRWAKERLPNESFIYLADNAHFPYGEKSADEVRAIVLEIIGRLIRRFDPKIVVIACNTATVTALDALRSSYRVPFVGVVPAVKPAAERFSFRRIGLLGTSRTVGDLYVERLINSFASDSTVVRIAARELIAFVENELTDDDALPANGPVRDIIDTVRKERLDSIVLGCTQLTLLDELFKKAFDGQVAIIDSREGVGRQLLRIIEEKRIASPAKESDRFFHTGEVDARYRSFADRFDLSYGGLLG